MKHLLISGGAIVFTLALTTYTISAEVEKLQALDGSQYAVVTPIYDGSNASLSYIRLFNGSASTSMFNVTVVNTNNGFTLGAASIAVPKNASPQYPVTAAGGASSIFDRAGVAVSSGAKYALYIQNSNALAGYAHVTFNPLTSLFENNSVCSNKLNAQTSSHVIANVHTSSLASGAYPSAVSIHNYSSGSTTVTIAVNNSATGVSFGQFNRTIAANATIVLSASDIETQLNFTPTSTEPHINVVITKSGGGVAPVKVTHTIVNAQLGGEINMTEACAVNAVAPTVVEVEPSVPTAYCATVNVSSPVGTFPIYSVISIAPNGRVRFVSSGSKNGYYVYGAGIGTKVGNTVSATSYFDGSVTSGTIQNGVISGVTQNPFYGYNISYSATTSGCY